MGRVELASGTAAVLTDDCGEGSLTCPSVECDGGTYNLHLCSVETYRGEYGLNTRLRFWCEQCEEIGDYYLDVYAHKGTTYMQWQRAGGPLVARGQSDSPGIVVEEGPKGGLRVSEEQG